MGFSGAYRRPVFGFPESLGMARALVGVADTVSDLVNGFTAERDAALAAWSGPWGEEFRLRAVDEDTNLATVVLACGFEADQWARAWTDAVTETNGVVYAEAVEEQKAYLEQKRQEYEDNREWYETVGDGLHSVFVNLFTGGW